MALDNINLLSSSALSPNSDKILLYRSGGLEASTTLLSLTNSALTLSGVYLDPVNQRVGIGTPNPSNILHLNVTNVNGMRQSTADGYIQSFYQNGYGTGVFMYNVNSFSFPSNDLAVGNPISLGARLSIKGSGSTSATTSLLVQNSSGTAALQVADNGNTSLGSPNFNDRLEVYGNILVRANDRIRLAGTSDGNTALYATSGAAAQINVKNGSGSTFDVTFGSIVSNTRMLRINSYDSTTPSVVVGNNATSVASAVLVAESTTQGFLPPRLTTTQKNAIATPAAGLMVYDTDLNRPCFYSGSAWVTL